MMARGLTANSANGLGLRGTPNSGFCNGVFGRDCVVRGRKRFGKCPLHACMNGGFRNNCDSRFPMCVCVNGWGSLVFVEVGAFLVVMLSLLSLATCTRCNNVGNGIISHAAHTTVSNMGIALAPKSIAAGASTANGFRVRGLTGNRCSLAFRTTRFRPLAVTIHMSGVVESVGGIIVIPSGIAPVVSSTVFARFSARALRSTRSLPSSLSTSGSIFGGVTSCGFDRVQFGIHNCSSRCSSICVGKVRLGSTVAKCAP